MTQEITLGGNREKRLGGFTPNMPQIKEVMAFVDPECVSEVLAANNYGVDKHLQTLVDIVETNHDDPRIQMQAMRAIDKIAERSANIVIAMAGAPDAPPPVVTTTAQPVDTAKHDPLTTFLSENQTNDRADEPDDGLHSSSLHLPPAGGDEEEEEEEEV